MYSMCFFDPKPLALPPQTQKIQYTVDAARKLNYIRAQAKILGFGEEIYESNRQTSKYVIFRNFDTNVALPKESNLESWHMKREMGIREIHFGTKLWDLYKDFRRDYLDTHDEETRRTWFFIHRNLVEYDDELCPLYYEAYLLWETHLLEKEYPRP
jgi:hypothetical protein